jgi:hypothetical protein
MVVPIRSEDLAQQWDDWEVAEHPEGVRWGIPWIEAAVGSHAMPGTTVVVGARQNVGKSFFTLELLHAMAESGPATYLSLEDPPLTVARRLRQGALAHPNLSVLFPEPGHVVATLTTLATPRKGHTKPLVVGVDYVQCLGFSPEALTGAMNAIRGVTLATGLVTVLASQVNRPQPEEGDLGVPPPHRLKGASAIEERADKIFMLGKGRDHTVVVELAKAKDAEVGARARYRRGPGGRLVQVHTSLDDDNEGSNI